ncbi:methyltransferase domain-containing protein [Spirosoma sp. HMF4905]|uniref:Methyltransferase domain-containing protein n=1 Tax=Spirosoma arboris TaxID=2682092 RepID=A0A7K1SDL1_9BACT|nr:methyltransferase [Spirosoma arboris]MVM31778.1 methyltransferase domain-containing protein [Spirosoma arboris]
MTDTEASDLIRTNYLDTSRKTVWADLGAGSGTFTRALAGLLQPGSTIYAIDTDKKALKTIPNLRHQVKIETYVADFIRDELPLPKIDGFLMANSLHYVSDQIAFLEKMSGYLMEVNDLLIIEYDTDTPNAPWVPYPVSYRSLTNLVERIGYQTIHKLRERDSIYGNATLYSALATRRNIR